MSMRGARIPLGSTAWVAEERNSALKIADQEVEEFSFSARNDFDWLNEHMAGIFDENEINVAGVFKTPGRLRTKTLASRKPETSTATSVTTTTDSRAPLADIFSSTTPKGAPNKFTQQLSHRTHSPSILIPDNIDHSDDDDHDPNERATSPSPMRHALSPVGKLSSSRNRQSQPTATDSGFYSSQLQDVDGPKSPTTRLQSGNRNRTTGPIVLKSPPRPPTSPRTAYKMFEKKDEEVEEREQRTSRPASPIPNWAANLFIPPNESKDRKSPTSSSLIRLAPLKSPVNKLSPKKSSPSKNYTIHSTSDNESLRNQQRGHTSDEDDDMMDDNAPEDDEDDEARSHSPSPVRSVMRKSSLNFAPFPAREPLVHKTPGAKGPRASNLDTSRSSYYPRTTNGKSLGSGVNEDDEDMDVDGQDEGSPNTMTYTQKLQDKISKLSEQQPKAARSSKSIHGLTALPQAQNQAPSKADPLPVTTPRKSRPAPVSTTPGAFPGAEEDDDDWMDAPAAPEPEMESIEEGFVVSKQRQVNGADSPARAGNTTPANVKHMSLSLFPDTNPTMAQIKAHNKSMSISSSHNSMASLAELPPAPNSPSKSPSRSMRESPLKTVKNKLSSILKGSKSLLASSAVVSAEGKQMLLPTANRVVSAAMASTESLHTGSNTSAEPLYPDISAKAQEISEMTTSPRPARKTRASTEREKKTQRDARLLREHIDKLERAREAEREKARLFGEQQEKEKLEQEARELELQQERGRQEELERQREHERQLERERIEREKREEQEKLERECEAQRQKELKRQRELERERKLQLEREKRERELELQRQKEREKEEREFARQHELQLQREREEAERLEAERLELERLEREREHQHQLELEREREREEREQREREEREAETIHQAEVEAELEAEREREMELRQREKQKALNSRRIPTPTESERPKFRVALTSPKKIMHTRQNIDEDDAVAQTPARTGASVARPATAQSVRKEIKRPAKPVASSKSRVEPPKHIVIKPTSLYPSTAALSANLSETLDASASSCSQLSMKSSQGSLKEKDNSSQSLKSSIVSSNGNSRTRSVDPTAKKREQEEQRRREAKAELERKRATQQEQQRRSEEKQKEEERKAMEAKKKARQAALERAKQTRAPPPAPRPQTAASDYPFQSQPSRPPSRVAQNPADIPRPPSAMKGSLAAKRQLEEEKIMPNRNGPMYQSQDSKRRRTGDDYDEDSYEPVQQPLKNAPIRPSSALKREAPTKSAYSQSAPSTARDLFKSQPGKTVDMSQFSKGAIPFAGGAPGSASQSSAAGVFKTPGRTALPSNAKSASKFASRPSPRFQSGDNIELPDIETEDEDEDSEEEAARNMAIAPWADSPDLKRALIRQETMDPSLIFGPPAPLNMEEVFSKNKDRWNKFRARTSSANWAGADRLTEEDIRKDMAARDKIRRDGGWSYDLGRDLA